MYSCYTTSGDKTSFEQNEWHGFSKDGYSSNITINEPFHPGFILFHSHWIGNGGIGDIDTEEFPFDGPKLINFYFNIDKNPSSTSYEYSVGMSYDGYDNFCNEIDKFARNNVEALSGHKMNELVEDLSQIDPTKTTYWYTFQSYPDVVANTYYNYARNTIAVVLPTYDKTYWLKN